jgi:RES domain-containing protein
MAGSSFTPTVRGTFYRAVDPRYRESALAGSRSAGRYSRPDQPTLYLSSAMAAHRGSRAEELETLAFEVEAERIVDLRDREALGRLGIDPADASATWQQVAAEGGTPPSWQVRDRLEQLGANGLIDPSRRSPGLWHLVLFRWNEVGAPTVAA